MKKGKSRRITERLLKHWRKLKGERRFPSEGQIDPQDFQDLWNDCFLIDLTDFVERGKFKYAYMGSELIKAYGDQLTEEEAAHLISTSNVEVVEKIKQVIRSKAPLIVEAEFTNSNNVLIRFREVMLPLGRKDDKVEFILGGMRWKAF